MMSLLRTVAVGLLLLEGASVHALLPARPRVPALSLTEGEAAELEDATVALVGTGTFTQPIDHNNPDKGYFSTAFWYNATNWKGPGSPIVVFTPGEEAADLYTGYLTERALTGMVAAAVDGAVLLIEHRYWGQSSPCENQTTVCLQDLTVEQAVADFVNFAKTAPLPFDTTNSSNADQAPWIWIGGSYSGALSAWIEKLSPGTFWAYHSTSGPVEAIYNYWQYFYPIQQGMPQNCSNDYAAIVEYVDEVFTNGTEREKTALKTMFAVEALTHDDDAAIAISSPIWYWQDIQFYSGYSFFYEMCDAIEGAFDTNSSSTSYSATGVGLEKALSNFAAWFTAEYILDYCDSYDYSDWAGEYNVQCFNSYNTSMQVWHDWTPDNEFDRTWVWLTCNEPLFYYQTGAPTDQPTVMSRLATAEYYERQCAIWFPPEGNATYGSAEGATADAFNARAGGWLNTPTNSSARLLYLNGEVDPWRSASVASQFRPGGPFININASDAGTAEPVAGVATVPPSVLIEDGIHCSDLIAANSVHPSVAAAQAFVISQMQAWVAEWP
ncbi:serine carboxypeptidase S28 [Xylariales sp. PMI_506]|nr:serine carboxypeptidase S28 [Xylariales sp. PMI_506]